MQKLLILDFGSPSTQALARKVREMGVFSEIHSYSISESAIKEMNPQAIILSGAANAAKPCDYIWQSGLPILELDYDLQAQSDLQVLQKFLFDTSGFCADWGADAFIQDAIQKIKKQVGDKRVILGLSGGVDSSVAAALLYKAIGQQLIPIFVDTGLMRYREATRVKEMFQVYPELQISFVDASELFLSRLAGIQDPEAKRKIIGATFIEVFEKEAAKYPDVAFLAQGTVYPDVIESVSIDGSKVKVKSHHNVGGLPEKMQLSLVEPLRMLFKDEVRKVGRKLLLPEALIERHPFPGPGLGVRILGDITPEAVRILQEADEIFISELKNHKLYNSTWQAFAVLLPIKSVGVKDDCRSYEQVCALRAVNTVDAMTAQPSELPWDFLFRVARRIGTEVRGISRVVYDLSSKPPATIEWE